MGCGILRRWTRSCGIWRRRSERPAPRAMQGLRLHECGKGRPGRTVMLAMLSRFCCGGPLTAFPPSGRVTRNFYHEIPACFPDGLPVLGGGRGCLRKTDEHSGPAGG